MNRSFAKAVLSRPSLIILATILIIAFKVLFLGYTIMPIHNHGFSPNLSTLEHVNAHDKQTPERFLGADDTGSYNGDLAFSVFTKNSFSESEYPFWNPYQQFGEPFTGAATSILYPPNIFRFILPSHWLDLIYLLNWFLFSWFIYLLAVELGVKRKYAMAGALTALSCVYFQIYLETNSISATLAWFPLFLLGIERSRKRKKYSWLILLMATYGLLNGFHPGPAISAFFAGFIFFLIQLFRPNTRIVSFIFTVGFGFIAGLLLSSFQIFPFVEQLVNDGAEHSTLPMRNYFDLGAISAFLYPYFFGPLNAVKIGEPALYDHRSHYLFLPTLPLFIFAGALIGKLARPKNYKENFAFLQLFAISIFCLLWIFGVYPFNALHYLPKLQRLNMNYLLGIVVTLFSVLCAFSFQHFFETIKRRILWKDILGGLVFLTLPLIVSHFYFDLRFWEQGWWKIVGRHGVIYVSLVVGLWVFLSRWLSPRSLEKWVFFSIILGGATFFLNVSPLSYKNHMVIGSYTIAFAALVFLLIENFWKNENWKPQILLFAFCFVAFQAFTLGKPGLAHRTDPFPQPDFVRHLRDSLGNNLYRSYGVKGFLFPNSSMTASISSMNLLGPIISDKSRAFIEKMDSNQMPIFFYGGIPGVEVGSQKSAINQFFINKKFWDYSSVRYLVADKDSVNSREFQPNYFEPGGSFQKKGQGLLKLSNEMPQLSGYYRCKGIKKADGFRVTLYKMHQPHISPIEVTIKNLATKKTWKKHISSNQLRDEVPHYFIEKGGFCHQERDLIRVTFKASPEGPLKSPFFPRTEQDNVFIESFQYYAQHDLERIRWVRDRFEFKNFRNFFHQFSFPIYCPKRTTSDIEIYVSTHGKVYHRYISMDFENPTTGIQRRIVSETKPVKDNVFLRFSFPQDLCQEPGDIIKATVLPELDSHTPFVVWLDDQQNVMFHFRVAREKPLTPLFESHETKAVIWENPDAGPRLYLANKLEIEESSKTAQLKFFQLDDLRKSVFVKKDPKKEMSCLDTIDPRQGLEWEVQSFSLTRNSVNAQVKTTSPALMVLVDSYRDGWVADIQSNNKPAKQFPVFEANGTFRAVCLEESGTHQVTFRYRPKTLKASKASFGLGLVLLLLGLVWSARDKIRLREGSK